jgi:malate dehydrogenase
VTQIVTATCDAPRRDGALGTVGVLGAAGTVGAAVTRRLLHSSLAGRIVAADAREDALQAQVIDLTESAVAGGAPCVPLVQRRVDDLPPTDLLIVAAAVAEDPRQGRGASLAANARLLQSLSGAIERSAGDRGVVLLVSNPVDVLAEVLRRSSAVPPQRILGYSLNDTVRFRILLGRELGVDPRRIDASVLGEHGGRLVPLFSRVLLDGKRMQLAADARRRVEDDLNGWFRRWAQLAPGRSSGWTTAEGIAVVCRALACGDTLPLSTACDGLGHFPAAFVSLPAIVDRAGTRGIAPWTLADDEGEALLDAARSVGRAADAIVAAGDRVQHS